MPREPAGQRADLPGIVARISQSPLRACDVLVPLLFMQSTAGRPSALPQGLRDDFETAGVMRFDARELRFDAIAGRVKRRQRKGRAFRRKSGVGEIFTRMRGCRGDRPETLVA